MEKSNRKVYTKKHVEYWLEPDKLQQITEWSRLGLIQEQLCKNMGIAKSTLHVWKKEHPEIEQAWLDGKIAADLEIVNAMFKSAKGYVTQEEVYVRDEVGELVLDKVVKKEVPGNVSAQSLWIKNRMPGFMKDNQLTETYRAKVEAETELIKAKIALLNGDVKDTSHLSSLMALFESNK